MTEDSEISGKRGRIVAAAVILLIVVGLLVRCSEPIWNWERRALPARLGVEKVLASTQEGVFREGCVSAVYQLTPETVNSVRTKGLAFLGDDTHPPNENPLNPYSRWLPTPLALDAPSPQGPVFAKSAIGGCNARGNFREQEIERAFASKGSYYLITSNHEGVILVAPREGIAAFLHYG